MLEVDRKELLRMLKVDYAVDKENRIEALQCIQFKNNKTVATEGYRIAQKESNSINFNSEFLLYKKDTDTLKAMLKNNTEEKINIELCADYITFSFDNIELKIKYAKLNYPDMDKCIESKNNNKEYNKFVIPDVKEFIQILTKYKKYQFEGITDELKNDYKTYNNAIILEPDEKNNLTISYKDGLHKTVCNNIKYEETLNDNKYIAVSVNYLIDSLKNSDSKIVTVKYGDRFKSGLALNSIDYILPVRI